LVEAGIVKGNQGTTKDFFLSCEILNLGEKKREEALR
jgi:hypothetical protein